MAKLSDTERAAIIRTVHDAYMEVFPTSTIEERLNVLSPSAYVAVTCSPSKGIDVTLDMTERLVARGFRVVPHLAAKMVRDKKHLAEIMARLKDLEVKSIFVPGGDAKLPSGDYKTAFELLRDIAEYDHDFLYIGVAAHPEGHPNVEDDVLLQELQKKQPLANYLVTQMCFDAKALGAWLYAIRDRGIDLPAWIGIPGVADLKSLLLTSMRIGVGDSLRFLRKQTRLATLLFRSKAYTPEQLLLELAPQLADPACKVAGHHIYCFNQVERSENWRKQFLESLTAE